MALSWQDTYFSQLICKGFHHTLITFPTVSCFITVCCCTPQPTLRVTQVVLTSYSQFLQWKANPSFMQWERNSIYISYGWCNSWGICLKSIVPLFKKRGGGGWIFLLLGKTQGKLNFRKSSTCPQECHQLSLCTTQFFSVSRAGTPNSTVAAMSLQSSHFCSRGGIKPVCLPHWEASGHQPHHTTFSATSSQRGWGQHTVIIGAASGPRLLFTPAVPCSFSVPLFLLNR